MQFNVWFVDLHDEGDDILPKRKTHEEFLDEMKLVNSNIEILDKYTKNNVKVCCNCLVCGNQWEATPNHLLMKRGCPKCALVSMRKKLSKSHEDFLKEMKSSGLDITIIGYYENNRTPIECKCNICGYEWKPIPDSLQRGSGCPKCAGKMQKTNEEFLKEISIVNSNVTIMSPYIKSDVKVLCECTVCKYKWKTLPSSLLQGSGCPKCAGNMRKTHSTFVKEIVEKEVPVRVLGKYINQKTKIEVECVKCGYIWFANPDNLLNGHGCLRCAGNMQKTTEEFIEEFSKINSTIEIIGSYISNKEKIACRCNVCGHEWGAKPNNLLNGQGCPNCNHTGTSFVEQLIYLAFVMNIGEENVISRDTTKIGKELDIYVPQFNLAVEYGAWYWHKDKLENDDEKRRLCSEHNIRLITIYDDCRDGKVITNDVICYDYDISKNTGEIRKLINWIMRQCKLEFDVTDDEYNKMITQAKRQSRKKTTDEFREELKLINPQIEVVGRYYNAITNIQCRCKVCDNEWNPKPYSLKQGRGCPNCARNRRRKTNLEGGGSN